MVAKKKRSAGRMIDVERIVSVEPDGALSRRWLVKLRDQTGRLVVLRLRYRDAARVSRDLAGQAETTPVLFFGG